MSRDVTCSSKYCARVDVERRVTSPVKSQIAMDPQYDYGGQGGYSDQQQGYGDSSEGEDSLPRYHGVKQTVPKINSQGLITPINAVFTATTGILT